MKYLCSIFLLLYALIASAQIDIRYNISRAGDELIKQQVEYKDPGREGQNVIWDFGKLKSINDEYSLVYTSPYLIDKSKYILGWDTIPSKEVKDGELIIGTEHNTMYYYRIKDNGMYVLGHENPTTILKYTQPMLFMTYPTNYKQAKTEEYTSKGLYSSRIPFNTNGNIQIHADAFGKIVLPSGDTLNHVLRIKTIQTIQETIKKISGEQIEVSTILESYKWYAKGYRYPIFETVKSYKAEDKENTNGFETAFFFPPQDHLYLDDDPDNLAVLDSLWNMNQKAEEIDTNNPIKQTPLTYNFYPNPVETILNIEYFIEQPTPVTITLYSLDGRLVKTTNRKSQLQGLYHEQIDCTTLSQGTYILKIQTNTNTLTSDKIVKK